MPAIAGAAIGLVGSALAIAALILVIIDRQSPPPYTLAGLDVGWSQMVRTLVQTVGLMTMSVVCGTIVWRRPRALLSLLFLVLAASLTLQAFASQYAIHGLLVAPGSLPLADLAAKSLKFIPNLGQMAGAGFLLLFPDGRPTSRRWWFLLGLAILYFAADLLIGLDDPYPLRVGPMAWVWVPVTLPPALWSIGAQLSFASGSVAWSRQVVAILFAIYLVRRLVSASGEARQQLKWFAYAGTTLIVAFVLEQADNPPTLDWLPDPLRLTLQQFAGTETAHAIASWSGILSALSLTALLPIAIGIAIVRYRLYDIDFVINKTILYGGLAVFVTGAYAIVVAGVGSLLGQRAGVNPLLTVVTIALVATLLLPVRSRLQAFANAAVYGKRARPYDVLSDFAASISRAEQADVLLPRMADLLREGTGASTTEVWVRLGDRLQQAASAPRQDGLQPSLSSIDEIAARHGQDARVELVFHDGELLGALILAKPHGDELTAVERRLFHDLASQAGLVLVRFRLVQELRESRARIVAAQEIERRRIERDLHDGAQQRFVNALLALGMAEAGIPGPRSRGDLIDEASHEVQAGLAELRNLARGLQPPLLAEVGIVPAVSDLAARAAIPTTVTAGTLPRYPDGLEAAVYFVVAEAMTNAAKHSGARGIEVRIHEHSRWLRVEVIDDGTGGADPSRGSGIIGLQDRVAALGGRMTVSSPPGAGTLVTAEFPCA
jgi:signal transduction histidine kinase